MSRILAIDYGLKRCGIAVTDPLKIIATSLCTVETSEVLSFLKKYCDSQNVECIVLGLPLNFKSEDMEVAKNIRAFAEVLSNAFENIKIALHDERFTSKIASNTLHNMGLKKSKREQKGELDKISAVIILQSYLASL